MAEKTAIEWTHRPNTIGSSWNPWTGCKKKSPGCAHCYMYREKIAYGQDPTVVVRSKEPTFRRPLKWQEPHTVFTSSWTDFFIKAADDWRGEAWDIIRATPQHTYLILTKEIERVSDHLPADWGQGWSNCWLGVSVENPRFLWRVRRLLNIPAVIHWVSYEPALQLVNFRPYLQNYEVSRDLGVSVALDWVVAGTESGPKARPYDLDWFRQVYEDCRQSGVAFFMKQITTAGGRPVPLEHWPEDLRVREFPEVLRAL